MNLLSKKGQELGLIILEKTRLSETSSQHPQDLKGGHEEAGALFTRTTNGEDEGPRAHLVLWVPCTDQQQLQRPQVAQPLARRADNLVQEGLAEFGKHTAVVEHPGEEKAKCGAGEMVHGEHGVGSEGNVSQNPFQTMGCHQLFERPSTQPTQSAPGRSNGPKLTPNPA